MWKEGKEVNCLAILTLWVIERSSGYIISTLSFEIRLYSFWRKVLERLSRMLLWSRVKGILHEQQICKSFPGLWGGSGWWDVRHFLVWSWLQYGAILHLNRCFCRWDAYCKILTTWDVLTRRQGIVMDFLPFQVVFLPSHNTIIHLIKKSRYRYLRFKCRSDLYLQISYRPIDSGSRWPSTTGGRRAQSISLQNPWWKSR